MCRTNNTFVIKKKQQLEKYANAYQGFEHLDKKKLVLVYSLHENQI
jgi:hypothetical protein